MIGIFVNIACRKLQGPIIYFVHLSCIFFYDKFGDRNKTSFNLKLREYIVYDVLI